MGNIGFIGAGSFGGPMVEKLLAAGNAVHLFARRPEVARKFAEIGATTEQSVAAVARSADVIVVCPFSEDQLVDILGGADGVLANANPGTVVIQHATVSVRGVTALADEAARAGVHLVDAPVDGSVEHIAAGTLTAFLGGDDAAVDVAKRVLGAYCGSTSYVGPAGSATATKLLNNLAFAAQARIACIVAELGGKLGIEPATLLPAIGTGVANCYALTVLDAFGGDVEQFSAAVGPYLRKDVALAVDAILGCGGDPGPLLRLVESDRHDGQS